MQLTLETSRIDATPLGRSAVVWDPSPHIIRQQIRFLLSGGNDTLYYTDTTSHL